VRAARGSGDGCLQRVRTFGAAQLSARASSARKPHGESKVVPTAAVFWSSSKNRSALAATAPRRATLQLH